MAIICSGDEHCLRFGFVKHVYVIGIKFHGVRNLGLGFVPGSDADRLSLRVQLQVRLRCTSAVPRRDRGRDRRLPDGSLLLELAIANQMRTPNEKIKTKLPIMQIARVAISWRP